MSPTALTMSCPNTSAVVATTVVTAATRTNAIESQEDLPVRPFFMHGRGPVERIGQGDKHVRSGPDCQSPPRADSARAHCPRTRRPMQHVLDDRPFAVARRGGRGGVQEQLER